MRNGRGVRHELGHRHQPQLGPLIAQDRACGLGGRDLGVEIPARAAGLVGQLARMGRPQPRRVQPKAGFLEQFAQGAGLGRFVALARAAGQVPAAGPVDRGDVVAAQDQQAVPAGQDQLRPLPPHPLGRERGIGPLHSAASGSPVPSKGSRAIRAITPASRAASPSKPA